MSTMIIEDLVNIRWYLVVALIIVMLVCLIYITLMRWVAAPMVWFSIFGVMGILSYCKFYFYWKINSGLLKYLKFSTLFYRYIFIVYSICVLKRSPRYSPRISNEFECYCEIIHQLERNLVGYTYYNECYTAYNFASIDIFAKKNCDCNCSYQRRQQVSIFFTNIKIKVIIGT